jgi:hypothetical protein
MRREHDDQSGDIRYDGAGQRYGRCGNAGRIRSARLLMEITPAVGVLTTGVISAYPWRAGTPLFRGI